MTTANQNPINNTDQYQADMLGDFIAPILDAKYSVFSITLFFLLLGVSKNYLDTPIYRTDAMVRIEEQQSSLNPMMESVQPLMENKSTALAEIEVIKSRKVVGDTVRNLNLQVAVTPNYFPVVGAAIARNFARKHKKGEISSPLFSLDEYAWGGEALQVDNFSVPDSLFNITFILVAGENGKFSIINADGQPFIDGEVGVTLKKAIEDEQKPFNLLVSSLKARPGTKFFITRRSMSYAIEDLQASLNVIEKVKSTGILYFTLESDSPKLAVKILNELTKIYEQQNVDQKSQEAQNSLDFLDKQLPQIKAQLEIATDALNEYRIRAGSIDLSEESKNILAGMIEIKTQLLLLQEKREELRQNYTESHPKVKAIDTQISRLQTAIDSIDKKIEGVPETQQVILRLSRDVEVNAQLYVTLLNNAETLKITKAGTVGNARIIDVAVPPTRAVRPNKPLVLAISIFIGLFVGITLTLIRKAMHQGVEDPDQIEKYLNIPIYATIPHSENQHALSQNLKRGKVEGNTKGILALENKDDLAIESLRSLRTTIHFALLEAHNNIIMITGPSPGVGKSFISMNLAVVLADSGKKILLIDGDLRKGVLHKNIGVERNNGLSDIISNTIEWTQAIHHIPDHTIDLITSGSLPPNPSELLMHERFESLLDMLSKEYDQIIIDSPPILAVTDSGIIGRIASATLMVVKAGRHPMRELDQCARRLAQAGVTIKGAVFNDMSPRSSRYGYGYGYGYGGYGYGGYGYGYGKYVYRYNYQKDKDA